MGKKKSSRKTPEGDLFVEPEVPQAPDFRDLLARPLVREPLPGDFIPAEEAEHLVELWNKLRKLHRYRFEAFVHAGGSGMVFKVMRPDLQTPLAMKIGYWCRLKSTGIPADRRMR
jgi:hypothetical protein